MDPRGGFSAHDLLADRAPRSRRPGESCSARAITKCGLHAIPPKGLGNADRVAGHQVDARTGRAPDPHRNGAHSKEPPGNSWPAAQGRLQVRIPNVAGSSYGFVPTVEEATAQ